MGATGRDAGEPLQFGDDGAERVAVKGLPCSAVLVPDTSLPGLRVVRELNTLITSCGRPLMCVSDNGTELTGMAILRWSQEARLLFQDIEA